MLKQEMGDGLQSFTLFQHFVFYYDRGIYKDIQILPQSSTSLLGVFDCFVRFLRILCHADSHGGGSEQDDAVIQES